MAGNSSYKQAYASILVECLAGTHIDRYSGWKLKDPWMNVWSPAMGSAHYTGRVRASPDPIKYWWWLQVCEDAPCSGHSHCTVGPARIQLSEPHGHTQLMPLPYQYAREESGRGVSITVAKSGHCWHDWCHVWVNTMPQRNNGRNYEHFYKTL